MDKQAFLVVLTTGTHDDVWPTVIAVTIDDRPLAEKIMNDVDAVLQPMASEHKRLFSKLESIPRWDFDTPEFKELDEFEQTQMCLVHGIKLDMIRHHDHPRLHIQTITVLEQR